FVTSPVDTTLESYAVPDRGWRGGRIRPKKEEKKPGSQADGSGRQAGRGAFHEAAADRHAFRSRRVHGFARRVPGAEMHRRVLPRARRGLLAEALFGKGIPGRARPVALA